MEGDGGVCNDRTGLVSRHGWLTMMASLGWGGAVEGRRVGFFFLLHVLVQIHAAEGEQSREESMHAP
jgi:hypothetical protein